MIKIIEEITQNYQRKKELERQKQTGQSQPPQTQNVPESIQIKQETPKTLNTPVIDPSKPPNPPKAVKKAKKVFKPLKRTK